MSRARMVALAGLFGSVAAASPRLAHADSSPSQTQTTFESGATLSYGVTLSLLQFSTVRSPDEPARYRNYAPKLEVLPTEIGFQFVYNPQFSPWRLRRQDGSAFQLISVGGSILARIKSEDLAQGNLSVAINLGFFDNTLSVGVGVDLYRGIPVLSATGVPGGATAYTGLLAWCFSPEGEVTPENVFVLVSFSLSRIIEAVTGKVQP